MSTVVEKAKEIIEPVVENLGYELVDIEYKSLYGKMNLTVFIYSQNGVSLEDCEKVNNALDEPLEQNDITDGKPYILNISSPGLDRFFKTQRDYERNLNKQVEIVFKQPLNKADKVSGKLLEINDDTIKMIIKGKPTLINKVNIKSARPYVKF